MDFIQVKHNLRLQNHTATSNEILNFHNFAKIKILGLTYDGSNDLRTQEAVQDTSCSNSKCSDAAMLSNSVTGDSNNIE